MATLAETLASALRLHAAGDLDAAQRLLGDVLKVDPRQAEAWHTLGLIAHAKGDAPRAQQCFTRAIMLDGVRAEYHNHLGAVLQLQSHLAEAMSAYRRAIELKGDYAEAHCNLGSAYKDLEQFEPAMESYGRAIALEPSLAEAHFNLGALHQGQSRIESAIECYQRAVALRPNYWQAQNNLGTALKLVGRFDEAMACYERALAAEGEVAEAHRNRALLRLLLGDYAQGWPEYEWRWQVAGAARYDVAQPRWRGQTLEGGTLLLKSEQGLGDTIQFIRYARLAKERSGAKVLVQCAPRLQPLLAGVAGIDGFSAEPWQRQEFDAFVPMLTLPAVFEASLETVWRDVPYLFADPARIARWRERIGDGELKVGVAWQGNPGYAGDAARSIPLVEFAPLAACRGVRLISLQKEHGGEQLTAVAGWLAIDELGADLDADAAFVDTAAVMQCLDLVVTSDTAIAHLAGALGVPVWVALQQVPDWRWLLAREDSPWYPSMRLFRQSRDGDWSGVFARMAEMLRTLSAGGRLG